MKDYITAKERLTNQWHVREGFKQTVLAVVLVTAILVLIIQPGGIL